MNRKLIAWLLATMMIYAVFAIIVQPTAYAQQTLPSSLSNRGDATLLRNQDGQNFCHQTAIIQVLDVVNEIQWPYTPDASFRYENYIYQASIPYGYPKDPRVGSLGGASRDFEAVKVYGACPEVYCQSNFNGYNKVFTEPAPTDESFTAAEPYKISSYQVIKAPTIDQVKELLYKYGAVAISDLIPAHTITFVGYDDARQVFAVINSAHYNGDQEISYADYQNAQSSIEVGYIDGPSALTDPYTARISVSAPDGRRYLIIKIGVEGMEPLVVWDLDNQNGYMPDDWTELTIDVPLPSYAADFWPPDQYRWYVEVTDSAYPDASSMVLHQVTFAHRYVDPDFSHIVDTYNLLQYGPVTPSVGHTTIKVFSGVDNTPPLTGSSVSGTVHDGQTVVWYTNYPYVTLSGYDLGSGLKRIEYSIDDGPGAVYSREFPIGNGMHTLRYQGVDYAGNYEDIHIEHVNVDTKPPVITMHEPSYPDTSVYEQGEVVIADWSMTDATSGIVEGYGPSYASPGQPIDTSTLGIHPFTISATDDAGHTTVVNGQYSVVDTTPPAPMPSPIPVNPQGWSNTNEVTLTATDDGSGIASISYKLNSNDWVVYTAPFTVPEGLHTLLYKSVDNAGNAAEEQSMTFSVDVTSPIITVASPSQGQYLLNAPGTWDWTTSDGMSGISSSSGPPIGSAIDTSTLGTHAYTITATDVAGNSVTKPITYTVQYAYTMVTPSSTKVTQVKYGSAMPVKLVLKDYAGKLVTNAAMQLFVSPLQGMGWGEEKPAYSSNNPKADNTFRYDAGKGQYVYNLDTSKLGVGTWQLRVKMDDGSTQTLTIKIVK